MSILSLLHDKRNGILTNTYPTVKSIYLVAMPDEFDVLLY